MYAGIKAFESHTKEIEVSWNQVLNTLSQTEREKYLQFLRNHGLRKQDLRRPYLYQLYHFFLYSGCLHGAIYYRDRPVFYFGIELSGQPGVVDFEITAREIRIETMIPESTAELSREILRKKLLPAAIRYIPSDSSFNPGNCFDYIEPIQRFVKKRIQRSLQNNQPVTIAHFAFQDLRTYFFNSGEFWTREVIHEIRESIQNAAQNRDLILTITPHSYVVLSPGSTQDQFEERYESLYVEVKSLILDYELFTHEIQSSDESIAEVFHKIKI